MNTSFDRYLSCMVTGITLQEGLAQFRKKNSKYFSNRSMPQEAKDFLLNHDVAHVVFGCNTSIYGEGVVKIWTTFGTDLTFWKVIKGYRSVNAFSLASKYSFCHVASNIFRLLLTIPKTIIRSRQMTKSWSWSNYEIYKDKPISEIRKEFNIRIVAE